MFDLIRKLPDGATEENETGDNMMKREGSKSIPMRRLPVLAAVCIFLLLSPGCTDGDSPGSGSTDPADPMDLPPITFHSMPVPLDHRLSVVSPLDSAGIENFKVTKVWKATVPSERIEVVKERAELTVARETGVARLVTMKGQGGEESRSDVFRMGGTEYQESFAGLWMCSGTTEVHSFVSKWMMRVRWLVNHAPEAVETRVDGKPVFHHQLDTVSIDRVFEETGMNLVSPREEFKTIDLDLYLARDTSIPLGYRSSRTAMVDSGILEHSISVEMSNVNELAKIERPPGLICWPGLAIETHNGSYYLANVEHSADAVADLAKVGLEAHGFAARGASERDGIEVYTYETESGRLELAVSVWREAGVRFQDFTGRAEELFARAVPRPMLEIDRDGPTGKRKGSTALYRGETVEGSVIVMSWTPGAGSRASAGR